MSHVNSWKWKFRMRFFNAAHSSWSRFSWSLPRFSEKKLQQLVYTETIDNWCLKAKEQLDRILIFFYKFQDE